MDSLRKSGLLVLVAVLGVGVAACDEDPAEPLEGPATLLAVVPQGGSVDVDPNTTIVVTFDHAIHETMVEYAALHEGDVTGPEVPGTWALSEDGTELSFTPDEPLRPATQYTIHLGGGMTDDHGNHVNFDDHGMDMGGEWAMGSMMTGGDMGGGMMGGDHAHMGDGWQHPTNGSYGMVFTFTTAG